MKSIRALLATLALLAAGAAAVLYTGLVDVGADAPHWPVTTRVLEFARERSIAARAGDAKPPALDDPALIALGAEHYAEMCTGCHLAPGMEPSEIRAGLRPQPPDLTARGAPRDPARTFWIIKHGLKMTGMPAWGATHDDHALWGLVAFVRALPGLDAAQYAALTAGSDAEGAAHEHHHDHAVETGGTIPALPAAALDAVATVQHFQALLAAGRTGDAAALLDPDVLIYEGGDAEKSRAEYASHHLGADAAFLKDARITLVARTGDALGDLAWVASESTLRKTAPKPLALASTETMVLRKRAAGWRIVHIHWSSAPG